jgi:prepilin-type processing-associated H-X9-DG protein
VTYSRISNNSYHYPSWNNGAGTWNSTSGFFPVFRTPNPSKQAYVIEGRFLDQIEAVPNNGGYIRWDTLSTNGWFGHVGKKMNCLFVDGHVSGLKMSDFEQDMLDDPLN